MSFFRTDPEIQKRRYLAEIAKLKVKKQLMSEKNKERAEIHNLQSDIKNLKQGTSSLDPQKVEKVKSFFGNIMKSAQSFSTPPTSRSVSPPKRKQRASNFGGGGFDIMGGGSDIMQGSRKPKRDRNRQRENWY